MMMGFRFGGIPLKFNKLNFILKAFQLSTKLCLKCPFKNFAKVEDINKVISNKKVKR